MTIYLVRHAHAGSRSNWKGPDSERPLSKKGARETAALVDYFDSERIDRALSSAAVRCQQTVAPVAAAHGLRVEVHEALTEGGGAREASKLVWELATDGIDAVLCSHGDVIPVVLGALGDDGVDAADGPLPKGALYQLTVDDGRIVKATFVDPRH